MQHDELLLTRILERAVDLYPDVHIATRTSTGIVRETYAELGARTARLANALRDLGVEPGDRVGSFAWNTHRHLELYFAVPGMGAVLHTLNIRLRPEQVAWIVNHAEDRVVLVDAECVEAFAAVAPHLRSVERIVVMSEAPGADAIAGALPYEDIVSAADPRFAWPDLPEDTACTLCYTSGTTGDPKGVLYSHRSMVLHATMVNQAEVMGFTSHDSVLQIVPMFHANAWGMPYAATLAGARQVYPGAHGANPEVVAELIESERVTYAGGVPTVWIALLQELERRPRDLSSLRAIKGGGAAIPPSLVTAYEERFGVPITQGWGMTETGPLAAYASLTPAFDGAAASERHRQRAKQGRPVPGMRARVVDLATGEPVPRDGATMGEIQVRGNWVAAAYFRDDRRDAFTDDGWLRTGDVAVDAQGYLHLMDRTKDLVKSGGEWIASVELESALMGHPDVVEAAVIGVPDDRWGERPLACVVLREGATASAEDLRAYLAPAFPRWWLPDAVAFVDRIPRTSVGKFDKRMLRERLPQEGGAAADEPGTPGGQR